MQKKSRESAAMCIFVSHIILSMSLKRLHNFHWNITQEFCLSLHTLALIISSINQSTKFYVNSPEIAMLNSELHSQFKSHLLSRVFKLTSKHLELNWTSPYFLGQWSSKCGNQLHQQAVPEPVRNAHSWASTQTYWIRKSRGRAQYFVVWQNPQGF